jgi:hypothetical protein
MNIFIPAKRFTERFCTMAIGKRDAARAALHNVKSLNPALHDEILDHMDAAGLFEGGAVRASASGKGSRMDKMQAEVESNPSAKAALSFALGTLRRHGITTHDFVEEDADRTLAKLNTVMAAKKIDAESRMTIKTALARCYLID